MLPFREETSIAPLLVSTCKSPSFGMWISMLSRLLWVNPNHPNPRAPVRAVSSTRLPFCFESMCGPPLLSSDQSDLSYLTENSTLLPLEELMCTPPLSACT